MGNKNLVPLKIVNDWGRRSEVESPDFEITLTNNLGKTYNMGLYDATTEFKIKILIDPKDVTFTKKENV